MVVDLAAKVVVTVEVAPAVVDTVFKDDCLSTVVFSTVTVVAVAGATGSEGGGGKSLWDERRRNRELGQLEMYT